MDSVILTLKNFTCAPWGLFTDTFPPQPMVWLTELEPVAQIDRALLTENDIKLIWQAQCGGVISSKNLFIEEAPAQKQPETKSNIFDVSELMRKEQKEAQAKKEFLHNRYPMLSSILDLPAPELKKKLKSMAKTAAVPFFQEAKKREEEGRNRKTVIAVIVEIIKKKVEAIGLASSVNAVTGESMVADAYYEMISEFEDEEEEVEIKLPPRKIPSAKVIRNDVVPDPENGFELHTHN